jgi:thiol-disulfide isomerase/thioredoxin
MLSKILVALLLLVPGAFGQQNDDVFVGQNAPEIKGDKVWINSEPLKLDQLRGKVLLIQFWARECPFCAETLPQVRGLYEKYSSKGLVIIGVHTPRADNEKDISKVQEAVTAKNIRYPIVIDNDYQIWTDYLCAAWPSAYVVDQHGVIRFNNSGVGRYEEIERVIEGLLKNSAK